jgi:hypothetical protein
VTRAYTAHRRGITSPSPKPADKADGMWCAPGGGFRPQVDVAGDALRYVSKQCVHATAKRPAKRGIKNKMPLTQGAMQRKMRNGPLDFEHPRRGSNPGRWRFVECAWRSETSGGLANEGLRARSTISGQGGWRSLERTHCVWNCGANTNHRKALGMRICLGGTHAVQAARHSAKRGTCTF